MDAYPRSHRINLRTEGSHRGLNPAIAELLNETGLVTDGSDVVQLAADLQSDTQTTMPRFLKIERTIGGIGLQELRHLPFAMLPSFAPVAVEDGASILYEVSSFEVQDLGAPSARECQSQDYAPCLLTRPDCQGELPAAS